MAIKDPLTKMMSLETGYADLGKERIAINKAVSKINRQARERSKESVCCLCGKVCSSFCNSHSVPEFSLKKIAEKRICCTSFTERISYDGRCYGSK